MKTNLISRTILAGLICLSTYSAAAQMAGGPPIRVNPAMAKVFGTHQNFTAVAEMRMLDAAQRETVGATMNYALLNGKVRSEMDMSQIRSAQMPPQAAAQMKQLGLDRNVTIVDPVKKTMTMIYPGLQAYTEMPLPATDAETLSKDVKIETTEMGKETIDGHPCVKNKVVMTDDKGQKQEAITWNATDLKDFPIQTQFEDKGTTAIMRYKNVQLGKADEKMFDAPAGYTKYASIQQIMQAAMQKMMGGAVPR